MLEREEITHVRARDQYGGKQHHDVPPYGECFAEAAALDCALNDNADGEYERDVEVSPALDEQRLKSSYYMLVIQGADDSRDNGDSERGPTLEAVFSVGVIFARQAHQKYGKQRERHSCPLQSVEPLSENNQREKHHEKWSCRLDGRDGGDGEKFERDYSAYP